MINNQGPRNNCIGWASIALALVVGASVPARDAEPTPQQQQPVTIQLRLEAAKVGARTHVIQATAVPMASTATTCGSLNQQNRRQHKRQ